LPLVRVVNCDIEREEEKKVRNRRSAGEDAFWC
jgi:hypothetical protein